MVKKGQTKAKKDDTAMEVDAKDPAPLEEAKKVEEIVDLAQLMKENISTLLRAIELDDRNLVRRVWRRNTAIRKGLSLIDFQDIVLATIPPGEVRNKLFENLDPLLKSAPAKGTETKTDNKTSPQATEEPLLEVECYLHLHLISLMLAQKKNDINEKVIDACEFQLSRLRKENRQTLDSFVSKTYSFLALASERNGKDTAEVIKQLVAGHRTSCLRLYEQSQATLINLILRNYISSKLYTQAKLFISSITFPDAANSSNVGNNEQIKYLYYTAKVAAVQAEYSKAERSVGLAIRKCPINTALGFRMFIHKLHIVTKLLLGEIPDRSVFSEKDLKKELLPYFYLVKSVKNGSVADYDAVCTKYKSIFARDDLMTLVDRLRSSVIKAGLRNINIAYSRISFKDIKEKLELNSEKDAELICAKAIRDHIIDNAIIDSTGDEKDKALISTESVDVYSTGLDPTTQFQQRTAFCLQVHNAAMKAHKYPPNSHKAKFENARKKKEDQGDKETEAAVELDDFIDEM